MTTGRHVSFDPVKPLAKDNLGDILTMKFHGNFGADEEALDRTDAFLKRRDVPMIEKIRAWNYTNRAAGFPDEGLATTAKNIEWLATQFPSDC